MYLITAITTTKSPSGTTAPSATTGATSGPVIPNDSACNSTGTLPYDYKQVIFLNVLFIID